MKIKGGSENRIIEDFTGSWTGNTIRVGPAPCRIQTKQLRPSSGWTYLSYKSQASLVEMRNVLIPSLTDDDSKWNVLIGFLSGNDKALLFCYLAIASYNRFAIDLPGVWNVNAVFTCLAESHVGPCGRYLITDWEVQKIEEMVTWDSIGRLRLRGM